MNDKIPWVRIEDAEIKDDANYLIRIPTHRKDKSLFQCYWDGEDIKSVMSNPYRKLDITHIAEISEPED